MTNPNMQDGAEVVSWDDQTIQAPSGASGRKMERFKPKQGPTYRVLILDQPVRVYQHYKKDFGYLRCLKSLGKECAFCNAGEKAAEKFGVNVLVYPDGASAPMLTDVNTKVQVWMFGPKIFSELRNIKGEWGPLSNYDLKISCTNEQYQHLAITPCREALYTTSPAAAQIKTRIDADIYDLTKILGRQNTVAEVQGIYDDTLTRDQLFAGKGGAAATFAPNSGPPAQSHASVPSAAPAPSPQALNLNALLARD